MKPKLILMDWNSTLPSMSYPFESFSLLDPQKKITVAPGQIEENSVDIGHHAYRALEYISYLSLCNFRWKSKSEQECPKIRITVKIHSVDPNEVLYSILEISFDIHASTGKKLTLPKEPRVKSHPFTGGHGHICPARDVTVSLNLRVRSYSTPLAIIEVIPHIYKR